MNHTKEWNFVFSPVSPLQNSVILGIDTLCMLLSLNLNNPAESQNNVSYVFLRKLPPTRSGTFNELTCYVKFCSGCGPELYLPNGETCRALLWPLN